MVPTGAAVVPTGAAVVPTGAVVVPTGAAVPAQERRWCQHMLTGAAALR